MTRDNDGWPRLCLALLLCLMTTAAFQLFLAITLACLIAGGICRLCNLPCPGFSPSKRGADTRSYSISTQPVYSPADSSCSPSSPGAGDGASGHSHSAVGYALGYSFPSIQ
jgi:hypothetical protein